MIIRNLKIIVDIIHKYQPDSDVASDHDITWLCGADILPLLTPEEREIIDEHCFEDSDSLAINV